MRRLARLAAPLAVAFAASSLVAQDAPSAGAPRPPFDPTEARALARATLDEARGEKSRERYVLHLPEDDPPTTRAGGEVVLVGGFISNYLIVFRWSAEAVECRYLSMMRTWFYNPYGEKWSSRSVEVTPQEFARRWGAACLMIGATTERRAPYEPASGGGSGGATHTPEAWIRIRDPGRKAPLYLGNRKYLGTDGEGVRDFDDVRGAALFRLFEELVDRPTRKHPDMEPGLPLPVDSWRPFLRETLDRYCKSALRVGEDDVPLPDESLLLVDVCLRALSEAGEMSDRVLLDRVDARLLRNLEGAKSEDYATESARNEIPLTRQRIRFRWEWDSAGAAKAIRENPRKLHAQEDLVRWMRARYHEKDPKGYREMLLADIGSKDRLLLLETILEIGRRLPAEAPALLGPFREFKDDPEILEAVEEALTPPK